MILPGHLLFTSVYLQLIWDEPTVQLDQTLWWASLTSRKPHEHLQGIFLATDMDSWFLTSASLGRDSSKESGGAGWASAGKILEMAGCFLLNQRYLWRKWAFPDHRHWNTVSGTGVIPLWSWHS